MNIKNFDNVLKLINDYEEKMNEFVSITISLLILSSLSVLLSLLILSSLLILLSLILSILSILQIFLSLTKLLN